jgi:hypothetical protein
MEVSGTIRDSASTAADIPLLAVVDRWANSARNHFAPVLGLAQLGDY